MRSRLGLFTFLCLSAVSAFGQNNFELIEMFRADQAARQGEIDWEQVRADDAERRESVLMILEAGGIQTALDYYNAAMIFQHGDSVEDIRVAHSFASISTALDQSSEAARWLKAATWDRLMLNLGQPQWYGTQFVRDEDTGRWKLYDVAPDIVTDEERKALAVPALAESLSRVALMNGEQ
jgi:hypothetical protein